jgi:hypothetical protein
VEGVWCAVEVVDPGFVDGADEVDGGVVEFAEVVGVCFEVEGAIGAFIFGMTTQGIVYANWDPDWLKFFIGATLLAATLLNMWVRGRAARR